MHSHSAVVQEYKCGNENDYDKYYHVQNRIHLLACNILFPQIKMAAELSTSINIKEPRWDQSTFVGRAKHFFTVTDPRNILLTNEQLAHAHKIITDYR